jgi:hypothetical protein
MNHCFIFSKAVMRFSNCLIQSANRLTTYQIRKHKARKPNIETVCIGKA